jgi:hypothetical protein
VFVGLDTGGEPSGQLVLVGEWVEAHGEGDDLAVFLGEPGADGVEVGGNYARISPDWGSSAVPIAWPSA